MTEEETLDNIQHLADLNNWFDPSFPKIYIQITTNLFNSALEFEEDRKAVWLEILKHWRDNKTPNHFYYQDMINRKLRENATNQRLKGVYKPFTRKPLTKEEKVESQKAAKEAYQKVCSLGGYSKSSNSNENRSSLRKSKVIQNVKLGLVEVIDSSMMQQRLENGPLWMSKEEAISRNLMFKDHRESVVDEMSGLGRVGTSELVEELR